MLRSLRRVTVATLASVSLFGAPVAAQAANQSQGDALVNVQIGDITVRDVNVTAVIDITATLCDVAEAQVTALAIGVDQTNRSQTVCKTESGPVRIRQN